jgi:hypothetical protein
MPEVIFNPWHFGYRWKEPESCQTFGLRSRTRHAKTRLNDTPDVAEDADCADEIAVMLVIEYTESRHKEIVPSRGGKT